MLARLLDYLFPVRDDEAILRETSEQEFLSLLDPEVFSASGFHIVTLLPFTDKRVRAALHEAKYRGNEKAFKLLALALGEYLEQVSEEMHLRDAVLIPVPLGNARRNERGFNQVEEIAKHLQKNLNITIQADALVRTRETVSQISLPRWKRLENMRDAFGAATPLSPTQTYLLLDDVTTTGATLVASATALQKAGAHHLSLVALAH